MTLSQWPLCRCFMGLIDKQASLLLSRKRSLARRLSSVKKPGVGWGACLLEHFLECLLSERMSITGEKWPLIFAWLSRVQTQRWVRRLGGYYQPACASADNWNSLLCHPIPHLHYHSAIWLLRSDYPPMGFYSPFLKMCLGLSFTVSSSYLDYWVYPCVFILLRSLEERENHSCMYALLHPWL